MYVLASAPRLTTAAAHRVQVQTHHEIAVLIILVALAALACVAHARARESLTLILARSIDTPDTPARR